MEARKTARTARPIESQPQTHSTDTTILETVKRQVATTDFIKVEKNLASLGFFTPSNKRIRGSKQKKICITRQADGNRIEVRAVILPSAAYGLPITGDQDKYFALQKIICDIRRQKGEISNPVGFTSAELLRILGLRVTAGKNYEDIVSWARRMTLTGICSEGIIYLAGRKVWASDTFHVFERFVSVGNQMPDGSIADKHYVWLSDWQLENINNNHVFPVDLEVYRRLKNHIAKALVPLLQIWLYATREGGSFEKRYRDLCQILNICQYQHLSKIKEKVGPSLEELTKHHYLAGWQIRETSDGADFKIIFYHGEKFNRDQLTRMDRMLKTSPRATEETEAKSVSQDPERTIDRELLHQLMKRGITEKTSVELLRNLRPGQEVMDQLEWGDHLLRNAPRGKFYNPGGILIALVKDNVIPPETFETSRKRKLRESAQHARDQEDRELARLELAYIEYKDQELTSLIQRNHSVEELATLVEVKKREMLKQDRWKRLLAFRQDTLEQAAQRQVRADIATAVPCLTFAEFRKKMQMQSMEERPTKSADSPGFAFSLPWISAIPRSLKT
ncbi:MAG: hypothetical protein DMG06_23035 [Acidobacteria bacterium]|nr:MAG: hypothetical protein DMG06_23035 [Acidobacteriota bacterium]